MHQFTVYQAAPSSFISTVTALNKFAYWECQVSPISHSNTLGLALLLFKPGVTFLSRIQSMETTAVVSPLASPHRRLPRSPVHTGKWTHSLGLCSGLRFGTDCFHTHLFLSHSFFLWNHEGISNGNHSLHPTRRRNEQKWEELFIDKTYTEEFKLFLHSEFVNSINTTKSFC